MYSRAPSVFALGVNYPWLNYAEDFGVSPSGHRGLSLRQSQEVLERDFAEIRESGVTVARWFLFGDGRSGFLSERGIPLGPDSLLLKDTAALLAVAERSGLKLCLSLIDYLWLLDHPDRPISHANERVLQFAAGREAFLERVLIPMFAEFRAHPALFAWEIANEPEWAIREFGRDPAARMHFSDFRAFAREISSAVREHAEVPVTLGSARLMWVRAWIELGLDFYQAHYYPAEEAETKSSLAESLSVIERLDRPLWLGELPARDASVPGYLLGDALNLCLAAGLSGAAVWRWTKPESAGTDRAIGQVEPAALRNWTSFGRGRTKTA